METTSHRNQEGVYSSSETRVWGITILSSLRSRNTEFNKAFLRLVSPLGTAGSLDVIAGLNENDFQALWLPGPETSDGKGRRWLPNPWYKLSPVLINSLLDILHSDVNLRRFLKSLNPNLVPPSESCARNWMATGIEAIMPFYSETLLLGAASGTMSDIGWTRDIDLFWEENSTFSRRLNRRPNTTVQYPGFISYLGRLRKQRRHKSKIFSPEPNEAELSSPNINDQMAVNFLRWQFCESAVEQTTKSAIRVAQEIPWLITHLSGGALPKTLSEPQNQALRLLKDSGCCQNFFEEHPNIPRTKVISARIETTLIGPKAFEKRLNLNWYPPLNEFTIRSAAMRILAILFYEAGRRCVCVSKLLVKDFIGNNEQLEVLIRHTKVEEMNNAYCPIGYLASEGSLQFIHEWRSFMLPKYSESLVVELALDCVPPESEAGLHSELIKAFQPHFSIKGVVDLHDFRRFCATWLPVRMMISQDLQLLNSPAVSCCRDTPLFSANALKRLGMYMKSDAVDDPLELIAGALGNLTPTEIRRTYCRSWPVLLALRCHTIWKKTKPF